MLFISFDFQIIKTVQIQKPSYINQCIYIFKSIKHKIFTKHITKIALSSNDDKRAIQENGINTFAWGHYKIK